MNPQTNAASITIDRTTYTWDEASRAVRITPAQAGTTGTGNQPNITYDPVTGTWTWN